MQQAGGAVRDLKLTVQKPVFGKGRRGAAGVKPGIIGSARLSYLDRGPEAGADRDRPRGLPWAGGGNAVERLVLARLTVGQHGLRYAAAQMHALMDFVAAGGLWSEAALREHAGRHGLPEPSLIRLAEFPAEPGEPPQLLIHDGHHRLVGTHLAGRDFLYPEEYRVTRWTYDDYLAVNFGRGWVTPFDPRTHVRHADFAAWKGHILAVARQDQALAERLIREQPDAYRQARRYRDLAALACDGCDLELERWRQKRAHRRAPGRPREQVQEEGRPGSP
jgi:hypothetical protein